MATAQGLVVWRHRHVHLRRRLCPGAVPWMPWQRENGAVVLTADGEARSPTVEMVKNGDLYGIYMGFIW